MQQQSEVLEGFRLSAQQERLWALLSAGVPCHAQTVFSVAGDVDADLLRRAAEAAVERNEILRTAFRCLDGMDVPIQVIRDAMPPLFTEIDLAGRAEAEREAAVAEILERERAAPFDPESGPALRLALLRLAPGSALLAVTTSPLAGDPRSHRNLARELADLYAALAGSGEPGEPPVQYVDVSEWQNELLAAEEGREGREHWRRQAAPGPPPVAFPFAPAVPPGPAPPRPPRAEASRRSRRGPRAAGRRLRDHPGKRPPGRLGGAPRPLCGGPGAAPRTGRGRAQVRRPRRRPRAVRQVPAVALDGRRRRAVHGAGARGRPRGGGGGDLGGVFLLARGGGGGGPALLAARLLVRGAPGRGRRRGSRGAALRGQRRERLPRTLPGPARGAPLRLRPRPRAALRRRRSRRWRTAPGRRASPRSWRPCCGAPWPPRGRRWATSTC